VAVEQVSHQLVRLDGRRRDRTNNDPIHRFSIGQPTRQTAIEHRRAQAPPAA
jgi:hypothetical protein